MYGLRRVARNPAMRFGLLSIPFTGMCEACFRAWWRNLTGQELAPDDQQKVVAN
jgi:hypothetical protein